MIQQRASTPLARLYGSHQPPFISTIVLYVSREPCASSLFLNSLLKCQQACSLPYNQPYVRLSLLIKHNTAINFQSDSTVYIDDPREV